MLKPNVHSNGLGHDRVLSSNSRTPYHMISAAQSSAIVSTKTSQPAVQRRDLASQLDTSLGISVPNLQLIVQHRVLNGLRYPLRITVR